MNLHSRLRARAAAGDPIRVGLIGAGKFGAMFLAQARRTPGLHVMAIADLDVDRAHQTCGRVGWPDEAHDAADFAAARRGGGCHITDDAQFQRIMDSAIESLGLIWDAIDERNARRVINNLRGLRSSGGLLYLRFG